MVMAETVPTSTSVSGTKEYLVTLFVPLRPLTRPFPPAKHNALCEAIHSVLPLAVRLRLVTAGHLATHV